MDKENTIQTITKNLLEKLELTGEVSVAIDESGAYRVHIETEETGLLIGYHGRTLESFQIILSLLVSKETGEWARVYVNVGDYREKREEALMHMAMHAAERAMASGRPIELPHLSSAERRVIHMTLSGDERVETESLGEGSERTLVIRPK